MLNKDKQDILDSVALYLKIGNYVDAHPCAQQLYDEFPDEQSIAEYMFVSCALLGLSLAQAGDFSGALPYLEQAHTLKRDDKGTLNNIFLCHFNLGKNAALLNDYRKAASHFERALEIEPSEDSLIDGLFFAYNNIGFDYAKDCAYEQALQSFEKAESLKLDNRREIMNNIFQACTHIGYNLGKNGQSVEALPYFERAYSLMPNSDMAIENLVSTHNSIGVALFIEEKYMKALPHFERAHLLRPTDYKAINALFTAYNRADEDSMNSGQFSKLSKRRFADYSGDMHARQVNDACWCGDKESSLYYQGPWTAQEGRIFIILRICSGCGTVRTEYVIDSCECRQEVDIYSSISYRHKRSLLTIRKFARPGNLLDIGCNTGGMIALINKVVPQVTRCVGIDLNGKAISSPVEQGIDIRNIDIDEVVERFDNIVLTHSLEHILDLQGFFKKIQGLVNDKSRIYICVPNISSRFCRYGIAEWPGLGPQDHPWHFSKETLIRVIAKFLPGASIINVRDSCIWPYSVKLELPANSDGIHDVLEDNQGDQIEIVIEL